MAGPEPHVTADEVHTTTRAPARPWLAVGGVGLSLGTVALLSANVRLPPAPTAPTFSAIACAQSPTPEACFEPLPEELRGLPDRERYQAEVVAAIVADVDLSADPTQLSPSARAKLKISAIMLSHHPESTMMQELVSRAVRHALARADPWTRARQRDDVVFELYPPPVPVTRVADVLDWSAPPPSIPPVPSVAELEARAGPAEETLFAGLAALYNQMVRDEAPAVAAEAARRYDDARASALQRAWREIEEEHGRDYEIALARRQHAVETASGLRILSAMTALVALAMAATWAWLRPLAVVVTPHHLSIGGRRIPWTEVTACRWTSQPLAIETRSGTRTFRGRALPPGAIEALRSATERARERSGRLEPLDRASLGALAALRGR